MKRIFFLMSLLAFPVWGRTAELSPRIHFVSNSDAIPESEEKALEQNIAWFAENSSKVIILEGHCDEWGESWYNIELGDRRARSVKAYLIEQGVDPERIILVVSFGEEKPLVASHTNEAWKQNRRVEFVVR